MIRYCIMAKLVIDTDEFCDTSEAARMLGIGYATLFRRIKEGRLFPLRVSRRTLIPKSEIERLNNEEKKKTAAQATAV